ncbi:hypothetical protein BOX30_01875 [Leptospirillum ferriphilum]|uniref:Uncharacterized protein n=2 Tax=Leptospirillum ferriphilum TaxID=178606 RepID=A0A059XWF7_9BACT|nr:hypothetical protein Y981_01720 [Leptospirillum ferriphilum YSK]OOH75257.1 hypothetical protein BOX24_00115 [Leptospirillum ferriphilum]OOH83981.1 hypothetical protein BOX30_01875 [Leptospirillum ferriphilum]
MDRKAGQDVVFRPEVFFEPFSVEVLFCSGRENKEGPVPSVGRTRTEANPYVILRHVEKPAF